MNTEFSFHRLVRRSIQLDALAYLIIAGLLVLAAILAFMVFNSIQPPDFWVFGDEYVRLIGLGLVAALVFYLLDQHARLRRQLMDSHERLQQAQLDIERACKGLSTAHHAAEVMTVVSDRRALEHVVSTIRNDFRVDAVAVVGDEVTAAHAEGIPDDLVADSVTRVASEAVRTAAPIAVANAEDGSHTLAVPLRVMGRLRGVLCMWQRHDRLSAEELEGLGLIARVLELGWESQLLYGGVEEQRAGIVKIVSHLIDQRMPGYMRETERIAELSEQVGAELGMEPEEIGEMRIAAELRDLGTLSENDPDTAFEVRSERRASVSHPLIGSQLAELGNFSEGVRRAILCHHECPDGSGYPMRLTAAAIPLPASVIHACEAFVELARADQGPTLSETQALRVMRQSENRTFDARVIGALTRVIAPRSPELEVVMGGAA